MHSRPMHGYQEEFEGRLYFFTKHVSGKTGEIDRFDKLNLAYADIANNNYISDCRAADRSPPIAS